MDEEDEEEASGKCRKLEQSKCSFDGVQNCQFVASKWQVAKFDLRIMCEKKDQVAIQELKKHCSPSRLK